MRGATISPRALRPFSETVMSWGGEADAAHGCDPVRQPELVGVFQVRRLLRIAAVDVHVDEARQGVHAGGVDLVVGVAGRPLGLQRQARPAGLQHVGDPVPLDDDVDRAARRRARPVDEGDATDDQLAVGAETLVLPPGGRGVHRRPGLGGRGGLLRRQGRAAAQADRRRHRHGAQPPHRTSHGSPRLRSFHLCGGAGGAVKRGQQKADRLFHFHR
ncbi:hypothetical protein LRS10_11800 [Phenylobacterium sp. J426]|uniref:hypothetical protein n=1 Tax=Phenylobacterium sp. J426 TaxID=2898439 RepID=UPI0021511657|nr:hypothetical protein [Phenylobacterium sp. J426]MCR5874790.1 hypothetical protein [Phenylobacterium sp. J426]